MTMEATEESPRLMRLRIRIKLNASPSTVTEIVWGGLEATASISGNLTNLTGTSIVIWNVLKDMTYSHSAMAKMNAVIFNPRCFIIAL